MNMTKLILFLAAFFCLGGAAPDCGGDGGQQLVRPRPRSDYAGTYKIEVRLSVFRRKANGKCWDGWKFCNDPEPFGTIVIGSQTVRLPATCRDSRFCLWRNDIKQYRIRIEGNEELEITLIDQDIRNDDQIGACRLQFAPVITKARCGQSRITITFTKVE